jgi:hypothetical protein
VGLGPRFLRFQLGVGCPRLAFTLGRTSADGDQRQDQQDGLSTHIDPFVWANSRWSDAYFALYDKVTSADVKRVAQRYFTPSNRTVVTLKAAK